MPLGNVKVHVVIPGRVAPPIRKVKVEESPPESSAADTEKVVLPHPVGVGTSPTVCAN